MKNLFSVLLALLFISQAYPVTKRWLIPATADNGFFALSSEANNNSGGRGQVRIKMCSPDDNYGFFAFDSLLSLKGATILSCTLRLNTPSWSADPAGKPFRISTYVDTLYEGTINPSANPPPPSLMQEGSSCHNYKQYSATPANRAYWLGNSSLRAINVCNGNQPNSRVNSTLLTTLAMFQTGSVPIDTALINDRLRGTCYGLAITYAGTPCDGNYMVIAKDQADATIPVLVVNFTWDPNPPSPISGLSATALSASSIRLDYTGSASDDADSIWIIMRTDHAPSGVGDSMYVARVANAAGATSSTLTGLADNTTYYFQLFARDTADNFAASGPTATATTPDGPPRNTLSIIKADSSSAGIIFRCTGDSLLPSDVNDVYVWVSQVKANIINKVQPATDTIAKSVIKDNTSITGLTGNATLYYIGVVPRDAGGIFSDSVKIDSFYTPYNNPVTFTLSQNTDSIHVYATFNYGTINSNVDSVYIHFPDTGYVKNQYLAPDTAFTLAQFLALPSARLIIPNLNTGRYYFSIVLVDTKNGVPIRSNIAGSDTHSVYASFNFPANPVTLELSSPNTGTISYELPDCALLAGDNTFDSVVVFYHADSATVANTYKSMVPSNTIPRSSVGDCSTYGITGLLAGTKYYVGVATRNTMGNLSRTITIYSQYTHLSNPLTLSAAETDNDPCDSSVILTVGNLGSLTAGVDRVKIYYYTLGYITDPFSPQASTTVLLSELQANNKLEIPLLEPHSDYYFTVSVRDDQNPNSWAAIDSTVNGTHHVTEDYGCESPPNPFYAQASSISDTSITFTLQTSASVDADIESVYIFISTDSMSIDTGYKDLAAWRTGGISQTGPFTVDTLHDSTAYFFGVAVQDTNGLWSTRASIRCITTKATPPVNYLVFDSLRAGGDVSAHTNRIYAYWTWSNATLPAHVKFLYRFYNAPGDTPIAYNDPGFSLLYTITPAALSGMDSITELQGLQYNAVYTIAAYAQDSRGVWSTVGTWDTLRTVPSSDTTAPSQLAVNLDLVAVNSTTIRMKWNVGAAALAAAKAAENGNLRLGYDYNKSGLSVFDNPLYRYRFYVSPAAFVASDSIDISGLDANATYYFSVTAVDSVGNAAVAPAASRDSVATTVAGFTAGTVVSTENAYNNFTVDWTAAMVSDGIGGFNFANDASVRYITIVATDTGYYYGAMPLADGLSFSNGVAFYSATFPIDSLTAAITDLELYRGPYYITAYASVNFHAFGSNAATAGSAYYVLSAPSIQDLGFSQVNDSILRLTFSVADTNVAEQSMRIWSRYGKNSAIALSALPASSFSGTVTLTGDTIAKAAPCTAYVNVSRLGFGNDLDSDIIYLRLYVSDMAPPLGSADDSTLCSLTVDRKGPVNAAVIFAYNRITTTVSCTVHAAGSPDLSVVRWDVVQGAYANAISYAAPEITFQATGADTIYVLLADAFGNTYATAWYNFTSDSTDLSVIYPPSGDTTIQYDNGMIDLTISSLSLASPQYKMSTNIFVGRSTLTSADLSALGAKGVTNVTRSEYWFLTQFTGSMVDTVFSDSGIDIAMHFNPSVDTFNNSLKIFRVFSDGLIECLGGVAESLSATDAVVSLNNFVMDDFWKSNDGETTPSPEDTFMLIIGIDRIPLQIVGPWSGIDLSGATSTLRFGVRDNTVNLDVRMMLFTYRGDGYVFDTVFVQTDKLTNATGNRDTVVSRTWSIGQWVAANQNRIDLNGIYCAIWISDGSYSKYYYLSPDITDTVTATFSKLQDQWQIVGVPCSLIVSGFETSRRDIMNNLEGFDKGYDRERLRMLRLASGSFLEYAKNDTGFYMGRNQAYLMITRYSDDNSVRFKANRAVYRGLASSRGYMIATGSGGGQGWRLLSLPFRGFVKQSAVERMSVHGTSHSAFKGRMWSLTNGLFTPIDSNSSMPGSEQGFLTYLFAGDTLFAPVTDDAQYLPGSGVAGKGVSMSWSLGFSVSSNGAVVDGLNEFGEGYDEEFSDLVFPGSVFACGFKGSGPGLQSVVRRAPAGGLVSTWDYVVENHGSVGADISFGFAGMDGLPSGYMVYIEDGKQGYGSVVGASGTSSWYVGSGERRVFRIVVGDGGYISRSVVKQLPVVFSLDQNYPNPFNPVTTIGCAIPSYGSHIAGSVLDVSVYDVQGRLVQQVSRAIAEPGYYHFVWRADDMDGREVGSGVYMYRMIVQDGLGRDLFTRTRKMMMMK